MFQKYQTLNLKFKNILEEFGYPNVNTLEIIKCIIRSILESGLLPIPQSDIELAKIITINSFALLEHVPFEKYKNQLIKKNLCFGCFGFLKFCQTKHRLILIYHS